MKATDLIARLNRVISQHGNVEVFAPVVLTPHDVLEEIDHEESDAAVKVVEKVMRDLAFDGPDAIYVPATAIEDWVQRRSQQALRGDDD